MAKRIVVRKGDVFCIEVRNEYKIFFQYIAIDKSCMNGGVIRFFKTRYSMDYQPDVCGTVNDEVTFYTHSLLRDGLEKDVWYKVGSSKELGLDDMEDVFFGRTQHNLYVDCASPVLIVDIDRLKYWQIWSLNQPKQELNSLVMDQIPRLYPSHIYPYTYILDYAEYGYYRNTAIEYEVIKRVPHDYADSYVKRNFFGLEYLFHFKGSKVEREIIVGNDKSVGLSVQSPESGVFKLSEKKFWEINWKNKEFITKEEFEEAWRGATEI